MNPSPHHKSPLPAHPTPSSPPASTGHTMSQEGANLPQEVEGSHDQATAPHGSILAGVESPTATVMPAGPNSSSVSKLATSAVNNAGSFERANPAVLSAGEDDSAASSKIASPAVLQAGEDSNAAFKIASPAAPLAGEESEAEFKLTSPTTLFASEDKSNDAGAKLASPAMLQDNNAAARSKLASPAVLHAGDDNTGGSKIASPAVLHAAGDDNNGGSKIIASPGVAQAIVDTTTGSKLNSPAARHAGERNNAVFKVPNPVVLHASKDMDNSAGRPKFASPVLLDAAKDNRARTKLTIQAASHAGGSAGSSRLTRSATAALHAAKDNASKLAIHEVPRPHHAGQDNNTRSSKAAIPAAVDAGKSNVAGKQRAYEAADVGSGSGKRNAAAEYADHELHIFTERERRKKMKNMFTTLHGLLPQLPDKADKATIVGEAVIYIRALEKTRQKLEKLTMERNLTLAAQQQQLAVGASSSRAAATAPRHPAPPALPTLPAAAAAASSSSREVNLADMVHSLQVQQAAAAAAAGSSSSSASAAHAQLLPRGAVPFPAPPVGFQTWSGQNAVVSVAGDEAYINLRCPRDPGTLTKALFVLDRHSIDVVTTTVATHDGFRMYGIHARATPPASATARFPETLCAEDRFKLAVSEMLQMINLS